MSLFEFLECFDLKTPIIILDENGSIIEENIIGEVALRTVTQREVVKAYPKMGKLEVMTTYTKADMEN